MKTWPMPPAPSKRSGAATCVWADGEVLATVPLPLGGIMSDQPWEQVYDESLVANQAAASLGCEIASPYMILAFVGLAGVPDYGLTEKGLIDTMTQSFIPVLLCCRCPQHIHGGGEVAR